MNISTSSPLTLVILIYQFADPTEIFPYLVYYFKKYHPVLMSSWIPSPDLEFIAQHYNESLWNNFLAFLPYQHHNSAGSYLLHLYEYHFLLKTVGFKPSLITT